MNRSYGQDFMDTTAGLVGAWLLCLAVTAFVGARDGLRRLRAALTPKGGRHG